MKQQPNAMKTILMNAYHHMFRHFGPRHWWPAGSPFEVIIGAVLTQNTAWTNVEKAIKNIKSAGALSMEKLQEVPEKTLSEWIRPSGYFNIKAKRLKAVIRFIWEDYGGNLEALAAAPLAFLREQLLRVYGVGPETADSILLYALNKPIFVVDAYTRRIFSRHDLFDRKASYGEIQAFFMDNLPKDVPLYNEYHALIVETGKNFCRKKPLCHVCPLQGLNGVTDPSPF